MRFDSRLISDRRCWNASILKQPIVFQAKQALQLQETMTIDEFWDIVDRVHAASPSDMKNKCRLLGDKLRRLPAKEVLSFGRHFADCFYKAYHWDIWGAAIIIDHGCGDDSFMDFRSTLISLGRAPFEAALRDADSLADFDIDPAWATYEGYQYVMPEVYEEMTSGEEPPDEDKRRHPQEAAGVPVVEWEMSKRFPRLAAKYRHKDSDYAVEKKHTAILGKRKQVVAKVKTIMLDGGIIPSCGVIPPYRVVAKTLRSGQSPGSSNIRQVWKIFDFDEGHYLTAAFELEKASPAELECRPDLKGVRLKIDLSTPQTDDFEMWRRTLKE